jgi:hypothetical protein
MCNQSIQPIATLRVAPADFFVRRGLMIGWKIYFIVILFISLLSYSSYGTMRIWDIIDLILFIISMVALFGFCWSKKLLNQQLWRIFFVIFIVWNIYYHYFVPMPRVMDEFSNKGMSQTLLATINLSLYIPLLVALYLYSFKKVEIWKKENNNKNS